MNNQVLWTEYKRSPNLTLKKQIILQYTNLVHYVIQHSHFVKQSLIDEQDYFQFGVEGLSEAIERFDPEYGTKFETYAIQRIRGKILDELRKIQAKSLVGKNRKFKAQTFSLSEQLEQEEGYQLYEILPDDSATPEEEYGKQEMVEILVAAIQELPERERLVISLYYYENLNYKEIAEVLDITVSRVSQIHSKVIAKLKQIVVNNHD